MRDSLCESSTAAVFRKHIPWEVEPAAMELADRKLEYGKDPGLLKCPALVLIWFLFCCKKHPKVD